MTGASSAEKRPFPPGTPVGPGDVIADKYQVTELVAVGGMGIIVEAQHLQLGQRVAIKVLLPSEAEDAQQAVPRFLREARAAARLRSDHVVRIFDVGTLDSGLPYMVMELLDGQDLRHVVKTRGPLSVTQAVDYVLQAADAIGEAHESGIIHRDLKPSNLFLTWRSDGAPLVKVLDFGISKATEDPFTEGTLTTTRAMIGSPMYMSPEQVRDAKSVDRRSDIWSLGVILHELLAGRPAFRGESLPAICAAIAADPPAKLGDARADVPPELERVVLWCLEKDPTLRPQNIDALKAVLAQFAVGSTANAPTIPAPPGSARAAAHGAPRPRIPSHVTIGDPRDETDPQKATVAIAPVGPDVATFRGEALSPAPSRQPRRSRLWVLSLALGVGLAVVFAVWLGLRRPVAQVAATAAPTSFSIFVDSTPSGARVMEGEREVGKTPFQTRIERDSARRAPRVLTLRADGYQAYRIEQGDSERDIAIRADLVPEPSAEAPLTSAAAAPSVSAPVNRGETKSRTHWPTRPSTHENPPGTHPKPSTDIRLSR